ncbi:MAG: DUF5689 domain-containing protein [Firmicutes bacterium]|nr:DUF5689 domain-containing protein [Bacillota bacterium]MCM1401067.1 DUF5689 domain-containing protein [Bacteroides sp.]MCM1476986.1 DUF5689 domain-containing protein [Bacteroides sp.]
MKSMLAVALLALAGTAMTGCSEDLEVPPLAIPSSDWKANTTIADFKAQYWSDQENYCTQVGLTSTGEHVILGGRVIGNDITGNIYQAIQLQDATGAITISVAMKDMNLRYKVGEEMFIDVTDLWAGKYAGLFQIGTEGTYNSSPTTSKMEEDTFLEHTQLNGLPDLGEVHSELLTIAQINSMVNDQVKVQQYQSQLVKIEDVSFIGGGTERWAESGTSGTDRYLIDKDGNRLLVRNSGYSDFCDQILPAGHGNVVAILSWYRSSWQLVFRTYEDCTDFGGESYAPGGGEAVVTSLDETFEGCTSISDLGNWKTINASGNATWFTQTYSGNTFAACTGYNKTAGTDGFVSWLITPGLNVDGMAEKVFSFESMVGYSGEGKLEVFVMTSDDPTTATLTAVSANIPQPSGSWSDWAKSGNIDLSGYTGVVYVGFRYTAASAANYTTYRVDNIVAGKKVDGSGTTTPDTPSTDNVLYTLANSILSGYKYVMVIDSQVGTAIGQSLSYGRLAMQSVTMENSTSFYTSPVNEITITEVSTGRYTLVDSYGRYMGMDASHLTSFQLYDTNSGDGCLWTISIDANGVATIANVLNPNCHVVRSGEYTNIAPSDIVQYPTYTAPTLFVNSLIN